MLRDRRKNLRIEEMPVPGLFAGKSLSALNLNRHANTLLLAVKTGEGWVYKPSENYVITPDSTLVFMTTPEEREELARLLKV